MGQLPHLKLLLAALMITFFSITSASAFVDTQGHPSEAAIDKWSTEYGLLSGYEDGTFRPNDPITKGAFAGIIDRMMHFRNKSDPSVFRDIQGSYWADAILKLHAYAVMMGTNGLAEPAAPITRQQAVTMIARTFDFAADSILPHYIDDVDIAGYARSTVSEMTELGYLEGVADDYFRPDDPITRADVVRIFDNIMTVMIRTEAPFTQNVNGNVLISCTTGATLRNMYITGDLYVAPGVVGTVLLENVSIGGETRNFSRGAAIQNRATASTPEIPVEEEEPENHGLQPVVDPGQTADSAKPADSGKTAIDPGETTHDPGRTADSGKSADNGKTAIDPGETTYDPGRTAEAPPPDNGATSNAATPDNGDTSNAGQADNGKTDGGETTDSGKTQDSGKTKYDYGVTYDPGETTHDPGRTASSGKPSDSGKTSIDPGETTDPGVTENPENQVPENTPARPVTPENPENMLPEPYIPVNPNYGTLPNKPVSQWTISDVYTPGIKTGQYFTFEGRRIPVYQGVPARRVYAGEFVWRTGHRLRYVGTRYNAQFGVDVSAYQNRDRPGGVINWAAAKADGVQFAMIRVGLRGTSTGALREDAYYGQNIDGAMAQGIQTGVYIFAQAKTIAEAVEEADFVVARLRGHKINGPVSYDWEMKDSSYRVYGTSPEMATACAVAFCKRVAAAGYTPMVYNSRYVAYVKYDQGALAPYMMWYPQYPATSNDTPYPNFYYQPDYWQFTDSAVVEGIGTKIDANIWFKPKS